MRAMIYLASIMFVSTPVLAQVQVQIDYLFMREVRLEAEGAAKGLVFKVQSERHYAAYNQQIISGGKQIGLAQHQAQMFEDIEAYPDEEKWIFSIADGFAIPVDVEIAGEGYSISEFLKSWEGSRAEALLRTGESFTSKELPLLDQARAEAFVRSLEAPDLACDKNEDGDLTCRQILRLKFYLNLEEYEHFRDKGIEPTEILRGEMRKA